MLSRVPPTYDADVLLRLLGIQIPHGQADPVARLTVNHELVAATGYLWTPVIVAMADALCAFGVTQHWPEHATNFRTLESKVNFLNGAREGDRVFAEAAPLHLGTTTQVWDATVTNETTEREMASYRCTQLIMYT